ncbi:MAG: NAD-dependent epimerase/dehydratase family protein [Parvularculaceae bacterium]|nr:NAD-dependent epimerase/dehydratase family protein [Parvularculaceae bacterium]
MDRQARIVLLGAAGLVGQNLAVHLREAGYSQLVGVDKHAGNLKILKDIGACAETMLADLARPGPWEEALLGADAVVMLQAQIGGLDRQAFEDNNIISTQRALDALRRAGSPYLVHVSSSVVNSRATDPYAETKRAQERLVAESGLAHCILRPTLMFGWFDRKHLGWLARFMAKTPVFPIPGDGRYLRQPLYERDFCRIIEACLARRPNGEAYDISGLEKIAYIDIIRAIKRTTRARALIQPIPYGVFHALLAAYGAFSKSPPFTTNQLKALVIPESFPVIPWNAIFGVRPTPFAAALEETFLHPRYSKIELEF